MLTLAAPLGGGLLDLCQLMHSLCLTPAKSHILTLRMETTALCV